MLLKNFNPQHINACYSDFEGNQGIGRYVLIPGSDGRAKEISKHLNHVIVKKHPRQHNLYLGVLENKSSKIDVAVISSGMGCASMEVILYELIHLGAKRFLRVGTAGSLQNDSVKIGDIVVPTASIRDESSSQDYFPLEVPALPSWEWLQAAEKTKKKLCPKYKIHFGSVHCKSTLYAREFYKGPLSNEHKNYHEIMTHSGALASEMETSQLFIMSSYFDQQAKICSPSYRIHSAAILAIAGNGKTFAQKESFDKAVNHSITYSLELIKNMHEIDTTK